MTEVLRWTAEDEATLARLTERKRSYEATLVEGVEKVVSKFFIRNLLKSELSNELIKHAAEITTALHPFVSGPYHAFVIPVGPRMAPYPHSTAPYACIAVAEWTKKYIIDSLCVERCLPEDYWTRTVPNECDAQGNSITYGETVEMYKNVMEVRLPSGEAAERFLVVRAPT